MFKKSTLLVAVALAASATAQADYRFEVTGRYATGDITINPGFDADQEAYSFDGTMYLDVVETGKGPLSEAAFIDRASSATLAFTDAKVDFDSGLGTDRDLTSYGIGGRYVIGDAGWIVEAAYRLDETDFDTAFGSDSTDNSVYYLAGGKYIAENTSLIFGWSLADGDRGSDTDTYGLSLEHLCMLETGAIKFEGALTREDSNVVDDIDKISLGGTYYVNNNLGFGGSYGFIDGNDNDAQEWSLHSQWFVTEMIELSVSYAETDVDNSDSESDVVTFGVKGRF